MTDTTQVETTLTPHQKAMKIRLPKAWASAYAKLDQWQADVWGKKPSQGAFACGICLGAKRPGNYTGVENFGLSMKLRAEGDLKGRNSAFIAAATALNYKGDGVAVGPCNNKTGDVIKAGWVRETMNGKQQVLEVTAAGLRHIESYIAMHGGGSKPEKAEKPVTKVARVKKPKVEKVEPEGEPVSPVYPTQVIDQSLVNTAQ